MIRKFAAFIALVLLSLTTVFAQRATPPSQPANGPASSMRMPASRRTVTGPAIRNTGSSNLIRQPASAPLIVFLHGWGGMNPLYYGAWLDHLVKRGNIVVYPRYQATLLTPITEFTPSTRRYQRRNHPLQTERGHVKPDLNKFAVVGHSVGGLLAASVAALASESNLPRVRAVMSVEPGITESPINIPLADLKKIPAETLLLSVAGDQDTLVRDTDAKRVYYESINIPEANKDFITMITDTHGTPSLQASHRAPTAMDQSYDNGESAVGGGPDRVGNSVDTSKRWEPAARDNDGQRARLLRHVETVRRPLRRGVLREESRVCVGQHAATAIHGRVE